MSTIYSVRPEDIIPDGADNTSINGAVVRKGTIAAFLANINILENPHSSEQQKQGAMEMMRELAPSVIAAGLHQHVTFKNIIVENILIDAAKNIEFQ